MYMVQNPPKYDDVICEQPLSESGPLEDSNLEEDEVEEEFDPSCLPTSNSTDENSDEVDLLQGDILSTM